MRWLVLVLLAACREVSAAPALVVDAAAVPDAAPREAGCDAGAASASVSPRLKGSTLHSPMPGGFLGGWSGDTGLDIAGNRLPVHAIAAGTLDYAEWGHTLWTRKPDTAFSVRLALDEPIAWGDRKITHVYYTHLSKLEAEQPEGAACRRHVAAGERIGTSGIGNGVPHLHLGLLLDGRVEQDSWTYILREGEVRKALGGLPNGLRLP